MFEQTFVSGQGRTGRSWTVVVSLGLQAGVVAVALLVPLFQLQLLVAPSQAVPVYVRLERPAIPRRQEETQTRPPAPRPRFIVFQTPRVFQAPRVADTVRFAPVHYFPGDAPVLEAGIAGSGPGALPGAGIAFETVLPAGAHGAAVEPPPLTVPQAPIRISGGAQAARLMFGPQPVYPRLAVAARVEGVVRLQALISKEGLITNLQAVSGPALLVEAAVAAVRQWRYRPTLLGAEPVEVATDIEVRFTLNR